MDRTPPSIAHSTQLAAMTLILPSVIDIFQRGGWFEGRCVALPEDFIERFGREHAAAEVLRAFSGLHVGESGAGIECARSDILFSYFGAVYYQDGYLDDVQEWEARLNTRLAGIAQTYRDHAELFIATDGRCFERSIVSDDFWFVGASFALAVETLLRGLNRCRPLIRPDQDSIDWNGRTITKDSPEVYRYESPN